jgi:hypothetical protein
MVGVWKSVRRPRTDVKTTPSECRTSSSSSHLRPFNWTHGPKTNARRPRRAPRNNPLWRQSAEVVGLAGFEGRSAFLKAGRPVRPVLTRQGHRRVTAFEFPRGEASNVWRTAASNVATRRDPKCCLTVA